MKRRPGAADFRRRRETGRTTDRTVYRPTPRGRKAIAWWLAQPSGFIRIQNEPAAPLNGADLAADEQTVMRSLRAIRPHIEEQLAWLDRAEHQARALPHRERYLQINHRLSRRILAAFSEWVDEVEAEFRAARPPTRGTAAQIAAPQGLSATDH